MKGTKQARKYGTVKEEEKEGAGEKGRKEGRKKERKKETIGRNKPKPAVYSKSFTANYRSL